LTSASGSRAARPQAALEQGDDDEDEQRDGGEE
jgi:hypothetical protein